MPLATGTARTATAHWHLALPRARATAQGAAQTTESHSLPRARPSRTSESHSAPDTSPHSSRLTHTRHSHTARSPSLSLSPAHTHTRARARTPRDGISNEHARARRSHVPVPPLHLRRTRTQHTRTPPPLPGAERTSTSLHKHPAHGAEQTCRPTLAPERNRATPTSSSRTGSGVGRPGHTGHTVHGSPISEMLHKASWQPQASPTLHLRLALSLCSRRGRFARARGAAHELGVLLPANDANRCHHLGHVREGMLRRVILFD